MCRSTWFRPLIFVLIRKYTLIEPPLASNGCQEISTGYATRFYNLVHQNPQPLIGYNSYEYGDPQLFLNT